MTKHAAHKDIMATIEGMMKAAQVKSAQEASGIPGKDTNPESMGKHTDHVDKNKVKPETLPQHYEQHKGKDDPTHKAAAEAEITSKEGSNQVVNKPVEAKTNPATSSVGKVADDASDATKLGNEVLADIDKELNKASQEASGVPGKDTNPESMGKHTDHVDKNKVKPETLPQHYEQHKGKDDPTHKAAEAAEVEKAASFALGAAFAQEWLSKTAGDQILMAKEAGRKDFEQMIATAAAKLAEDKRQEKIGSDLFDQMYAQEKQAEALGAQDFHNLMQKAAYENEIEALRVKTAELEAKFASALAEKVAFEKEAKESTKTAMEKTAALNKYQEEEKENQKFAQWAEHSAVRAAELIEKKLRSRE